MTARVSAMGRISLGVLVLLLKGRMPQHTGEDWPCLGTPIDQKNPTEVVNKLVDLACGYQCSHGRYLQLPVTEHMPRAQARDLSKGGSGPSISTTSGEIQGN